MAGTSGGEAVDRESVLIEPEESLAIREAKLREREKELDERKGILEDRMNELDKRETELDLREQQLDSHTDVHPASVLPSVKQIHVDFEILPPGEYQLERIEQHFERFAATNSGKSILTERIRELHKLKPMACYVGKAGWYGYIAFEFSYSENVILECPIDGNAMFVLPSRCWENLARIPRRELVADHEGEVLRFKHPNHSLNYGYWLSHVKAALKRRL